MVMKIRVIQIILVISTLQMALYSQEKAGPKEKLPLSSKIYLSYVFGGQIYNDNILYNPGYSVLFTQSYMLPGKIDIGIGSGYTSLVNERFVPFYVELLGYKKLSANSPFIKFQLGYSAASYRMNSYPPDYDLDGGIYFNAGMGRQFRLKNSYSILFHWSYCHQSGKVNYKIFGNRDYSYTVNYDMIQISVGLIRDRY